MGGRFPNFIEENLLSAELVRRQRDLGLKDLREPRPIHILSPQTAPPPGMITGWMPFEFDYPCMIQLVIDSRGGALGSGQRGVVFAMPFRVKDAIANSGLPAIRSRGGKLWIPYPGKWYLTYAPADALSVDCAIFGMVYDDTCGAMQAERRAPTTGIEDDVITVLAAGATNLLIGDMTPQTCDGQIFQNIGVDDIWWKRGSAAGNPAAVGDGSLLVPGATVELVGDLAYPWIVNARAVGANCDVYFQKLMS